MAVIFSDTFTDTAGTNLTAHTPNIGTSWSNVSGTATAGISDANRARQLTATGSYDNVIYTATAASSPTDYEVSAVVRWLGSDDDLISLVARYSSGNFYKLDWFFSSGLLRIDSSGGGGLVQTTYGSPTINTNYTLAFRLVGTSLKAYVDGVEQLSTTNSSYTSGVSGLRFQMQSASPSNSNGIHVDNFAVDDLASGPSAAALADYLRVCKLTK